MQKTKPYTRKRPQKETGFIKNRRKQRSPLICEKETKTKKAA